MVWAGIRTTNTSAFYQCQFNYTDFPLIVPLICGHHLMFQHDNAQPHVSVICTQFLEAENVPVLPWPAYAPDMSPIEHVWDALDQRVRRYVLVPANIQQHCAAIAEEWDNSTGHNQQPD